MRARLVLPALLAGAMLVVALAPPAEAQGGQGMGRGQGQRRWQTQPSEPPAEQLGPGEYSLEGPKVLEAVGQGEGRQALAYYEKTAAQSEQQGDKLRAARAWHAAAVVALRLARFQKAIQDGNRAVDIYRGTAELTQNDVGYWASAYAQLGSAYRAVGDLPQAQKAFEEGLALAKARLTGRHEGQVEGYLMNGLAMVAFGRKDYQTALGYNTQAAQFYEGVHSRLGPHAPERLRLNLRRWAATSFQGIGRDQLALGHLDEADAAFDRALKYARLSGVREIEADILGGQGNLALTRRDWSKAAGIYQQSIALATQTKKAGSLAYLNQGLARALAGLGHNEEALAASREALRNVEEIRSELGDASLRSGYFEDKQGMYNFAVQLALDTQHPEEAFELAERSRSRSFLDLLGSQTPLSKGRTRALVDEEVKLRARLAEAQARAQDSSEQEETAAARASAEALERDYKDFLERVRKENREQASLMAVEPVTVAEIQGLLPEGTTLVEYLVLDGGITAWVVDRSQVKVVRLPGDRASLVADVRRFRTAITKVAPIGAIRAQAAALYSRLIEPLRSEIRGTRVVFVPHGALHYLPFSALRSPANKWVVEEFAVSTLPSASVLRYLTDKGTGTSSRALIIGNPDLGVELNLPWAEREARMVGQQERDSTVLVRGEATEIKVKKLLVGAGIIHFATHGDLSESDPLSSALLLVGGEGEDGRLEVREVFGLDLHARLIVLSACETGLGKMSRGDEIVGLQRAFLYAGTPAVVTTLWKVDDKATFELVRAFYAGLESKGPVEALRQAQLETMRAFPHPYAWAAFSLTGAPR